MARITNDQRLSNLHADALAEFDKIQSALRDERLQCLQDRRFYSIAGAQWEGPLGDQFENKPKFEVNKIHLSVIKIINEYRNNPVTVDFVSKDGVVNDKLSTTCNGLFRSDEQDSCAQEAYDNAFEEAVGGGFGAWRLRSEYENDEDDDDDRQRIKIEPIYDADSSVWFDLNAKRQDKSDARSCYVITAMTRSAYEEEWGDDAASWPKEVHQREFDWLTPDVVYIAELYKVEDVGETIRIFETLDGEEVRYSASDFKEEEGLEDDLLATGHTEVRQKRVKKRKVHKYIMSGGKILEDCGYIAGKNIPIVPVYGKRWYIDNVERCMGHVRLAKDSQRLKNMQLSKLGEISALSSIEKPILLPEQVAGHQVMWAEDNLKDYPYLLVNPITDQSGNQAISGPVGYTKSPQIPPAMAALLVTTEADMMQVLGNYTANEDIVSNISGKAVELIQQRLDMQTFIYMSNFSKGMRRCGEVWLSMARDLYVEEGRTMKVIDEAEEVDSVEMMRPKMSSSGDIEMENDLTEANFDVAVDVGPSSSSKRSATVRALTGMMQITQDPETMQVLSAMAMMNIEGEGIDEVKSYFRSKLIKMGVVQPTEQEAEDLMAAAQEQRPDANSEYLMAAAANEVAKAEKTKADTLLSIAKAEATKASTMETLSTIKSEDQKRIINAAEQVRQMSKSMQEEAGGMMQPPQGFPQREPDMANMSTDELIRIAQGGQ